jgi:hypothetical protein
VEAWLAARPVRVWQGDDDDTQEDEVDEHEVADGEPMGSVLPVPAGVWPDSVSPRQALESIWDRNSSWDRYFEVDRPRQPPGPHKQVIVALLPTADPSEVAAYLRFGGWNRCPRPQVHVAFARRWNAAYGARVVVNTADVVEFRVRRPVATRDDALRLAREHYVYCEDIVVQGTETIERLAAELLGATAWFFWWD